MSALEKLKQLEPIQFRYKKEFDPDQKLRAGFSAQQVQKIIPEAVVEVEGILMLDMDVLYIISSIMFQLKSKLKNQQNTALGQHLSKSW